MPGGDVQGVELADELRRRGRARRLRNSSITAVAVALATAPIAIGGFGSGMVTGSTKVLLVIGFAALAWWTFLATLRERDLRRDLYEAHAASGREPRLRDKALRIARDFAMALPVLLLFLAVIVLIAGATRPAIILASAAVILSLVLVAVILWTEQDIRNRMVPPQQYTPQGEIAFETDGDRDEWAIACSGGGIRSASFCLGALQRLRTSDAGKSLYERAGTVYAVSGGGYIATALHVARAQADDADEALQVFQPMSGEEDRLRRTSSYLFSSGHVRTIGVLSLLFGLFLHLVLIAALLRIVTWWLAWWIRDSGVLAGFDTHAAEFEMASAPWWVRRSWLLPILGLLAFLFRKATQKLIVTRDRPSDIRTDANRRDERPYTVPARLWRGLDFSAVVTLWAGLAATVVLLGAPSTLAALSNAAAANQPTVLVADLVRQAGFVTTEACTDAVELSFAEQRQSALALGRDSFSYGACGQQANDVPVTKVTACTPRPSLFRDETAPSGVDCREFESRERASGIAGAVLFVTTLAAIVRGLLPARSPQAASGWRESLGKLARTYLLPWVGTVLIVTAAVFLALRWTRDLSLVPTEFERVQLLYLCAGYIVAVKVFTDSTSSSLHPFYRERLARTFLLRRDKNRGNNDENSKGNEKVTELEYDKTVLVSQTRASTGPRLVLCAAANIDDEDYVPTQRDCTPFRFATPYSQSSPRPERPAEIGLSDDQRLPHGRRPAHAYERHADAYGRDATLAAAMAISGAAVSPLTGRASRRSRPYRLLIALANARLGVWLPNPLWVKNEAVEHSPSWWKRVGVYLATQIDKPGPVRLFYEGIGRSSILDQRLYVTDGGHYDNTAMVEALRDRPRRLLVIDASNDPQNRFSALGDAIATARMDLGLVIDDLDLTELKATSGQRAGKAWARATARPRTEPRSGPVTEIYVIKAVLTERLPVDLESYVHARPDFPRTSTGDQLYGEFDFEAYRVLGYMLTDRALADFGLA